MSSKAKPNLTIRHPFAYIKMAGITYLPFCCSETFEAHSCFVLSSFVLSSFVLSSFAQHSQQRSVLLNKVMHKAGTKVQNQ